ncbi:MAG: ribonuclease R [Coxiellaceae bacterium]|jgi:ribonuclease R|nr:ribonuclease R [Coxiellaceae bacterium]
MITIIEKNDPFFSREAKKYKKPIPSREFILQYLNKSCTPKKCNELVDNLGLIDKRLGKILRRRLNAMVRDGQLSVDRKGRYISIKQSDMLSGYVICHKDGYGFFVPDEGGGDIFLNSRQMCSLFPGDRVLINVVTVNRHGRREGRVVDILKRNSSHIVGRYFVKCDVGCVIPINKNIIQNIIIPLGQEGKAKAGQLVMMKIVNFPSKSDSATGQIIRVLGEDNNLDLAVETAIITHDLPSVWPKKIFPEIKISGDAINESTKQRKQLQHLPFVTIDGIDAKDFDDAVYCSCHEKDGWILYVAIADVSQYVDFNTQIDREALRRGNSIYFPQYVIPMLPEILANDLCSLKSQADRLVIICEMRITSEGRITMYEFYEAIIQSHKRFTYDEVFDLLEDKTEEVPQLLLELQELRNLYYALLKQRKLRGALDFSRVETQIIFNNQHRIKYIKSIKHHYVYGIIEECMLAANICASEFLSKKKIPALYRVHEGPDSEKLYNLRLFLKGLGLELNGGIKPQSKHYSELLKKIIGRKDQHLIETILLRSLKQAVYAEKNVGHFGLAYETYVHFTSPIRRYPDLINHRAIKYLLHGGEIKDYYYTNMVIKDLGSHCSMTERRADDAERDVIAWYKRDFMEDKIGEIFCGVISGLTNFGIFVELKNIFVEGLVHVTSLKNDYYKFDPIRYCLVGKRSGKTYRLGDELRIIVAKVDVYGGRIDFELV